MLEDKIILQDRGFDAGLAALMQNANKGMDPAALMAMMNNNGGFGGNGGWWWIWIILIFFCWGGWGGNGFGNRGGEASQLASQLNTDANTSLLMQAINGNKEAISNLSNTLNCDFNSVQSALNTINASVNQIACDTKLSRFPFGPFNPFFFGRRRRRLNTISGIPVLRTTGVSATTTEVRYDVNHQEFLSLPKEGLFFLDVRQASATADASLPVGLSDDNAENNTTQSMLRNALQEEVQAGDLQLNFRYLIYYNKCNNTYQLVNAYPTNIAAQAA